MELTKKFKKGIALIASLALIAALTVPALATSASFSKDLLPFQVEDRVAGGYRTSGNTAMVFLSNASDSSLQSIECIIKDDNDNEVTRWFPVIKGRNTYVTYISPYPSSSTHLTLWVKNGDPSNYSVHAVGSVSFG